MGDGKLLEMILLLGAVLFFAVSYYKNRKKVKLVELQPEQEMTENNFTIMQRTDKRLEEKKLTLGFAMLPIILLLSQVMSNFRHGEPVMWILIVTALLMLFAVGLMASKTDNIFLDVMLIVMLCWSLVLAFIDVYKAQMSRWESSLLIAFLIIFGVLPSVKNDLPWVARIDGDIITRSGSKNEKTYTWDRIKRADLQNTETQIKGETMLTLYEENGAEILTAYSSSGRGYALLKDRLERDGLICDKTY